MMNLSNAADRLLERVEKLQNPSVIGLDPVVISLPCCYLSVAQQLTGSEAVGKAFAVWGRDVIDAVWDIVPAVKPQMAFYEAYGAAGVRAFEETVAYAKEKGLIVVEDAKRGDIGNTARAYADGHLGRVAGVSGEKFFSYDADFLTVSPFLGGDSLQPLIDTALQYGKGIFVLVKTSNPGADDVQSARCGDGRTISEMLADLVSAAGACTVGGYGYAPIGAVVGATWPGDAAALRKRMPHSLLLIPGYGAQGGDATGAVAALDDHGLGGLVNSSRGVLYQHLTDELRNSCTREEYRQRVRAAAIAMRDELNAALAARKSVSF
jgi:orotidine-5'-phosphate decarboxylase